MLSEFAIGREALLARPGKIVLLRRGRPLFENAVRAGERITIETFLPRRMGTGAAFLSYSRDGRQGRRLPLHFARIEGEYDVFSLSVRENTPGLYFFGVTVCTPSGNFYGDRDAAGRGMRFIPGEAGRPYQLTVYAPAHKTPAWLLGGTIYHIFVDRFTRGRHSVPVREDAVLNPDWENGTPEYPAYPGAFLRNNEFFGGTLYGICEKLPYLSTLGVRCLYLSPVFTAYSNHKYDTGDYLHIDPMFGGEEAFTRLVRQAARHGIRIILDGVFNHTGADSVYFNKNGRYPSLGAYQSKESPYYDWYRFQKFPDRYTAWWDIPILPRIHPDSSASCREFFVGKQGVVSHWAEAGIAGMRLDVADELSDGFIADIKERLSEKQADSVLYGEVWEDASNKVAYDTRKQYYLGRELDGVMNYPLRTGIISYLRDGDPSALFYALTEVLPNMPKPVADLTMNLLGTHDTMRILTALAGERPEGKSNDELAEIRLTREEREHGRRLLFIAWTIVATLPGIPAVYYGDEAGMEGYSDPFNRRPYPWHRQDQAILSHYRRVACLRRDPLYREGKFRLLHLDADTLLFCRYDSRRVLLTAANRSSSARRISFSSPGYLLLGNGDAERKESGKTSHKGVAASAFSLPAESACVFSLRRGTRIFLG